MRVTLHRCCAGSLLVLLLVACSSSTSAKRPTATASTQPAAAPTRTTLPPNAFADALRVGDVKAAQAAFADNARFYTPVLPDPIVGGTHVRRLVAVLLETFQGRHVTAELRSPGHYALAFDAHIGAQPIHIFDLITFDKTGHIVTFASHGRPFAGIRALALAVAPHIPAINR